MAHGTEQLAVFYGFSSALVWGAADFSGGLASKKAQVVAVVFFSQIVGLICMTGVALGTGEPVPPLDALMMGGVAGFAGILGLVLFYHSLANGRMGLVAPLSAITAAILPIGWVAFTLSLPTTSQVAGLFVAIIAIWLLSADPSTGEKTISTLLLPILAGAGFGLFFIGIGEASKVAVFWPLVASKTVSIAVMTVLIGLRRTTLPRARTTWSLIILAGILDVAGNGLYALAAHNGRIDISATLGSMYPAATVLLAYMILKEPLQQNHWFGLAFALSALFLISNPL